MNLIIDQGNSFTKIGVFENEEIIFHSKLKKLTKEDIDSLFVRYAIKNSILSSVIDTEKELIKLLKEKSACFINFSEKTKIPIINKYLTPQTLGKDRLAAAVGANYLAPKKPLLIIDAGTTITFDFVNEKEEYLGGNISPGIQMRLEALNHFTQKLPLVNVAKLKKAPKIGRDTETAILAGVKNGIIYEVTVYLEEFYKKHPDILFFFTGGDAFFFETKLKYCIFVNENLLLVGLNTILNYNLRNQ